jgi:hypothetical protein
VPAAWLAIFLLWGAPVKLVLVGAVAQGLMLPFFGGAAVWLYYRRVAPGLRSGIVWQVLLWLSALCFSVFGAYEVSRRLGWLG